MIKSMTKKMNNKKGFTLIELIVVIAILGILAAIAIPRLGGLQEGANQKAIVANIKMLENAVVTYAAENNVDVSTVGTADLATLVPDWPAGPKATTTYSVVAGVTTCILTADIPGVPADTYTLAEAEGL